jgi:hypothetical protein
MRPEAFLHYTIKCCGIKKSGETLIGITASEMAGLPLHLGRRSGFFLGLLFMRLVRDIKAKCYIKQVHTVTAVRLYRLATVIFFKNRC